MSAGKYRRRVTFQQRVNTTDSFGQSSVAWTDLFTLWAAVEPLSGREILAAGAERAEDMYRIVIRYRTGITTQMRIKYGGKVFDITSETDILSKHKETEIMCKSGVNDG